MPFTSDERDVERRLPLLLTPTNEIPLSLMGFTWSKYRAPSALIGIADDHHTDGAITTVGQLRETRELLEDLTCPFLP